MINYKVQDGCHNCKYVFIYSDYDCGDDWFCNINQDRPLCGSCSMEEQFGGGGEGEAEGFRKKFRKEIDSEETTPQEIKEFYEEWYGPDSPVRRDETNWDKWRDTHFVSPCGKCDNWEKNKF